MKIRLLERGEQIVIRGKDSDAAVLIVINTKGALDLYHQTAQAEWEDYLGKLRVRTSNGDYVFSEDFWHELHLVLDHWFERYMMQVHEQNEYEG